jgi:N-methylhydantoinase A/oxoprolinase/acetone carboxylase beta subunit
MPVGMLIAGPALIEERETTTVVPSQASATIRDDGAIVINSEK